MDCKTLNYIIALAEEQSFSKAAKRCHVTQSTLSIQVQKFEEYLGITLFDRHYHRVEPTFAGREIISHARKAVASLKEMKRVAEQTRGQNCIYSLPN